MVSFCDTYCNGDNGYFENCTFHNLGSAHLTNNASAELRLSNRDTTFVRCQIGADTLKHTSTGGQVLLVKKQTNACTRVKLYDCYFRTYTNDTTRVFLRVNADGDIDRSLTLVSPIFDNFNWDSSNGGALLAVAVATPSGLVSGGINMFNVMLNGVAHGVLLRHLLQPERAHQFILRKPESRRNSQALHSLRMTGISSRWT